MFVTLPSIDILARAYRDAPLAAYEFFSRSVPIDLSETAIFVSLEKLSATMLSIAIAHSTKINT
jgi:hypothetical protein